MEIPHSKYITSQIIPDELLILISRCDKQACICMLAIPYVYRYWNDPSRSDEITTTSSERKLHYASINKRGINPDLENSTIFIHDENSKLLSHYRYGKLHKDHEPALIHIRGTPDSSSYLNIREYYQNGILHNEYGPARVVISGTPGNMYNTLNESYLNGQKVATIYPSSLTLCPIRKKIIYL